MIAALLTGFVARPRLRSATRYGAFALVIVLFVLSIRRTGHRSGRIVERLENWEKTSAIRRRMLKAARRPRDRGEQVDRLRDGRF